MSSVFADARALAGRIDAALLAAETTSEEVDRLVKEARAEGYRGICVPAYHLERAVAGLRGSGVRPVTVVGFPLGHGTVFGKAFEALEGLRLGAVELDVAINRAALRSGDVETVRREMSEIMAKTPECRHKFIVEVGLLTEVELDVVCRLANELGPAFVKTSTGFGGAPAAGALDVARLRSRLRPAIAIKAAGGIRTLARAEELVQAGAAVLGTSSAAAILAELRASG